LHEELPNAQLSILVRKGNESIYANHPFLKEVLVWNKQENKLKHLFQLLKTIRANKYDVVINCHRYASSGFLAGFSGANHIAGFKQNPFSFLFNYTVKHIIGNGSHEVERYNQLVADFTNEKLVKPKLYPSPSDEEKIKTYKVESYVCFAPASVWFTKQLPKHKWIALGQKISSETTIYLLGAPTDKELCEEIKLALPNKTLINLAGQLSLLQSCALMQTAKMNYVNDSAPLHLASAVNAPVTAFFCSTVTQFGFTPLSDKKNIIEVQNLACRPCGLHGHKQCPKQHFKCGNDISLDGIGS
jgi:heptosyltransferase II